MAGPVLKFGTSGWRAVIADEFTFGNARRAVAAIADVLSSDHAGGLLLVGYDTRFLADRFAREAALLLRSRGYEAAVSRGPIPTPVLSLETIRRKAAGALNFTASHNPPKYLGLKFSSADGAPALPEVTGRIEKRIAALGDVDRPPEGDVDTFDAVPEYLRAVSRFVDASAFDGFPVALDFRFGTSAGYLDAFFERAGAKVDKIHANPDPLFGGQSPQCSEKELVELADVVRKRRASLGLATDGDADRFGILDEKGKYWQANAILPLLAWDLYRARPSAQGHSPASAQGHSPASAQGRPPGIARSVATTHALDAVAKKFGVELHETPVGFKYIGELLIDGKIAIGGEESAGLTVEGHVPDKDGILADILVARAVRSAGKTLGELHAELEKEIGPFFSDRLDVPISEEEKKLLAEKRKNPPAKFGSRKVESVNLMDGLKLLLEGGAWVLLRESGTEPIARFYAEARSRKDVDELLRDGKSFLRE
jgi:phosphoglucomutase